MIRWLTGIIVLLTGVTFAVSAQPFKGVPGHTENTIAYSAERMGLKGKVRETNEEVMIVNDGIKDTVDRIGRLYDDQGRCTIAEGNGWHERHTYKLVSDTLYQQSTVVNNGKKYTESNTYLYGKKLLLQHSSDKPGEINKGCIYDEKGFLIAEYDTICGVEPRSWHHLFQNDANGNKLSGKCYEKDSLTQTTTMYYSDTQLKRMVTLDIHNDTLHEYKVTYDTAGRLLRYTDTSKKLGTLLTKEYRYDKHGNTVMYSMVFMVHQPGGWTYKNVISEKYSDFDHQGNWRKKQTTESSTVKGKPDHKSSKLILRKIEYY